MNQLIFCLCVFLLPVFSTLCQAGDAKPKPDDAAIEKVVADSLEAARKREWKKYVELVHTESLEAYRSMWLPALTAAAKQGRDKQVDLLPLFDKAADLQAVIAMKPKELFVSSMKGLASQLGQGIANPLNDDAKIIGTVREGDGQAYVVIRTRIKLARTEMSKIEVIALKRSGTEWKIMLPDVVQIMAETFARTASNTEKVGPVKDRSEPDK